MPNSKMRTFKPETMEALEAKRVYLLAFFDFMFIPLRVHSGKGRIDWEGHSWDGIGEVLKKNSRHKTTAISSSLGRGREGYVRGDSSASLPLDNRTREIISKGYYRGRRMELLMCSHDENGEIIERIDYVPHTIVEFGVKDNVVTFKAIDDLLDSVSEKDSRHKETVDAFRQQFKSDWLDTTSSSWVGWMVNGVGAFLGNWLGICIDILTVFRASKRRDLRQRWQARKRVYWFTTSAMIPRLWVRKRGYKVRADTLEEAKMKLYREIAAKIWLLPRSCINMLIYVDGRLLEYFNVDEIRRRVDPERWEATDPIRQWGKRPVADGSQSRQGD